MLYKSMGPASLRDSLNDENDLWIRIDNLMESAGLEVNAEGVCFDDTCVPLPKLPENEFISKDRSLFNISAFSRLMGDPIVRDPKNDVWVIGEGGAGRRENRRSLTAPDFTLPDIYGVNYSLSSYLATKIMLVSWASW